MLKPLKKSKNRTKKTLSNSVRESISCVRTATNVINRAYQCVLETLACTVPFSNGSRETCLLFVSCRTSWIAVFTAAEERLSDLQARNPVIERPTNPPLCCTIAKCVRCSAWRSRGSSGALANTRISYSRRHLQQASRIVCDVIFVFRNGARIFLLLRGLGAWTISAERETTMYQST